MNTSFVETIKSSEPVTSVLLGYLIVNEISSYSTYLTLIPICFGVGLSCFSDYSFHLLGFIFALLSNVCFSYRAVIAKQLSVISHMPIDEIQLFSSISVIGLIIVFPLTLFLESYNISNYLESHPSLSIWWVFGWCAVNGTAYTSYNILSFFALNRSDIITHAVLNVFRRVVIIASSIIFFQIHVTSINLLGIFLAIVGVVLFTSTKIKKGK